MPHIQQRRVGRSVVAHLTWTFGVCLTALVGVVATSTITGFSRERDRVAAQLRAGADGAAATLGDSMDEILGFLAPVARQPVFTSFKPDSCSAAFAGFSGFLETSGHIHLLRADGHEVCSVVASGHEGHAFVAGDWLARVLATGQPVLEQPADDPISGKLASTIAIPVDGDDGTRGVLAAVFYVGLYDLELPADLPDETELLVLDPDRTRVVQASESSAELVGRSVAGTGFDRLSAATAATVPGFDGHQRLAVGAAVPDSNLTVVVALPPATAMAAARKQLQQALLIGGISLLIVAGLGLALHRRLGRPIRRLTGSIRAAGRGDEDTWAPVEGPAELAEMAEAFNEMLGERRARETELRHRALHDVLTGLPNRAAARSCLARVLAEGRTAAVLFLDLDRFKLINDTHGHAVGDSLLVALGARLRGTTRTGCTVARFGGDEFVVLSPDTTEEDALAVAERLRDALEGCFRVEGHDLYVTGSVGVAVGHPGDVPDEVLRDADTAMYRAKDQGRPGYAFFDQDMRARSVWRLEMEQDLHLALDRGELMLHYQPIFEAASGSLAGVEALLRWNHPTRGMVSPADFIPIAEETGLIVPIGDWVLEEACRQSAAWRRAHRRGLTVSVNLAARQLTRPELADIVAGALAQAGAQPTDLVLEITEHGVLEDFASAFTHLQQVRALGVKVSVDDFGTGWSSLTYLQRLPVDEMKIDRSFISSLGGDGASSAIVGSLVAMAHGLGLRVVAEGVETPEQLSALRRFGCDLAQGFLLARPGPAEAIDGLVRRPEVAA